MVTPGISPTVSTWPGAAREDLAVHLLQELVVARAAGEVLVAGPVGEPGRGRVSGRDVSLLIMLITSIRKPSTPRSSHHRIMA